jgi:hypothetical protein
MLALTLALALTAPPALAFPGSWTGSLTYRDFGNDKAVVLPTTLTVTGDGTRFRFAYAYDDGPGKIVHDVETITLDPAANTYVERDTSSEDIYHGDGVAAFVAHGGGRLVLTGSGTDNGRAAEVRVTIDSSSTALVMRREVRVAGSDAFFTRHVLRFTRVVTATALRADAAILRHAYQTLHPGYLRYQNPTQADASFAELDRALAAGPSLPQALLAFTRFTASVRCGHSYPNFFNQSGALADAVFGGTNRLPFFFAWLDGRMIVTRNFSGNPALAPGTEITSIDGRSVREILTTLLAYTRADGSSDAKRIDQLQVTGDDRYEAFDVYYPLAYPSTATRFALGVRAMNAMQDTDVTVDALTDRDRAASVSVDPHGDAPLWKLTRLNPATAYLKMPTWETYNSTWDWRASLAATFTQLAKDATPNLIIDLRGNEGGTDVGNAIIAHLIDTPLAGTALERRVRYRSVPADLAPYLDTWDSSFKDWGSAAQPLDARFFRLVRPGIDGDDATIQPAAPRYRGRAYVLVDASNSSATFEFDQLVQQNHLATLAGTPTGGNQRGINGGAFFFIRLPNSGIEVDLPLIGTFPRTSAPDAGLTPDLVLERTQAGIAAGTDTVLESLLAHMHA